MPVTISSVTFGFEVFSPKSLIRFFEFNDMGWNISQECIRSMYTYLDALQKDSKWAYKRKLNSHEFGRKLDTESVESEFSSLS